MPRLVALDLRGGAPFVEALRRTWDAGDAVAVVPRRLGPVARAERLAHLRPHAIIDPDGVEHAYEPGAPTLDHGDALVAASSGSTGTPKLLVHTAAGLAAHAEAVHRRLDVDPSTDRWLACLPLDHLGGFGVAARAILGDVGLDVLAGFEATAVASAPVDHGSTLTSLVPTALDRIAAVADAFRWIVLGGSADPNDRPGNVVHTFGLTETGGGVIYDGLALDGVEIRIDRPSGSNIADEAGGGISLRTPTMARGRRGADGVVSTIVDGEGWLRTGDLGNLAPDGTLEVFGRADDLIVTGGENVWPGPIEVVLRTHPSVADVVVVGAPDPEWGQRVVAVVVPTAAGAPPSLGELRALVRERVDPAAAPRELHLVTALERTSLGKVVRRLPAERTGDQ